MEQITEVQGISPVTGTNSDVNAFSFFVDAMIKRRVNTALPVIVTAVEPGGTGATGRVTVRPLVCQTDAERNVLKPAELFSVPYSRVQGGVAAVICDPIPGDIGLAVFAQQDSSNVDVGTASPVQPGSFRSFDAADAFFFGGFLNRAPEVWLELAQDGTATLHAPNKIRIETPLVEFTGRLVQTGEDSTDRSTMRGGFINIGGEIVSNGISVEHHVHTGDSGGTTGQPR